MAPAPGCVNITPAGERRRRLSGWTALLAGLLVVGGLMWRDAPAASYLVVFPFALGAAFGFLQARNRTCVVLGFRGAAEVEGGGLRPVQGSERDIARHAARRILWQSVAIAAGITVVALAIAGLRFGDGG